MNVSSRQLKAFLFVASLGNFTRAAERMHMTQAGLSVMMRELETQLGARLFDRTPRSVTLTNAGEKLLPVALRVSEEIDGVKSQINLIGEKAQLTLRIAATPIVAASLLPSICRDFRSTHAEVHVRVVDCELNQVHRLVDDGEVDMGIGFFSKAFHGMDRTLLHTFHLMRVDAYCHADDEKKETLMQYDAGVGTPWSVFREEILLGLPPENPIQQLVENHLREIDCSRMERQSLNHFETLIAMVASGAGTTIVPSLAALACHRYPVRFTTLVNPFAEIGLYRITKIGREKYSALIDFSDALMLALPLLMSKALR